MSELAELQAKYTEISETIEEKFGDEDSNLDHEYDRLDSEIGGIMQAINRQLERQAFPSLENMVEALGLKLNHHRTEDIVINEKGAIDPQGTISLGVYNHKSIEIGEETYRLTDICKAAEGNEDLIRALILTNLELFSSNGISGHGGAAGNNTFSQTLVSYINEHQNELIPSKGHKTKYPNIEYRRYLSERFLAQYDAVYANIYEGTPIPEGIF